MKTVLSLGLAALLGIGIVGCTGDSDEGPTGIEIVDTVLAALETGDRAALTPLWRLEDTPCIDPNDAPTEISPLCKKGDEPGTLVRTFRTARCSGSPQERTSPESLSDSILAKELGHVRAVFAVTGDRFFASKYTLIYEVTVANAAPPTVRGYQVFLSEDQIVGINVGCTLSPEELIERYDAADRIPVDE